MKELEGKTALVTGATRGIGRAIALALADAGANVVVNYQSSDDAAKAVCAEIDKKGVKSLQARANVANEAEADAMIETAVKEVGEIDILVNNAGINRDRTFVKMTKAMWDEVLGVNLNGPFNVTHKVLPAMVAKGWGRIVNISSMGGQTGNFGQANYSVTKGGLISFTMTLAREVARKGITVNSVSPGYTETDMTSGMPDEVVKQVNAMIPVGRMAKPEEIACAVTFLSSPAASYITGQVISVNGGMYM